MHQILTIATNAVEGLDESDVVDLARGVVGHAQELAHVVGRVAIDQEVRELLEHHEQEIFGLRVQLVVFCLEARVLV